VELSARLVASFAMGLESDEVPAAAPLLQEWAYPQGSAAVEKKRSGIVGTGYHVMH